MMHARLKLATAAAALMLFSTPASAADFSFQGSLANPNDAQLFNFVVGAPSNVTLRTWSYAGGVNAAGTAIPRGGFDPILSLFGSNGAFLAQNDDGATEVDPVTGLSYDSFIQIFLAPGSYTVSVTAYSNFAIGPNLSNGFDGGGSFGGRTRAWAFDVLNVTSARAVPEPGTWTMMLIGFGATGVAMRYRRRRKDVAATA